MGVDMNAEVLLGLRGWTAKCKTDGAKYPPVTPRPRNESELSSGSGFSVCTHVNPLMFSAYSPSDTESDLCLPHTH